MNNTAHEDSREDVKREIQDLKKRLERQEQHEASEGIFGFFGTLLWLGAVGYAIYWFCNGGAGTLGRFIVIQSLFAR